MVFRPVVPPLDSREGVPGGRGGVQRVDPQGLLPGLRADNGHAPCTVLRLPGGLGGRRRRGAAVVDLRRLAAVVLAGPGEGSDRSVAGMAGETGQATGGGRVGREAPQEAGGGGAELPGEQPGEDGLPALPQGRAANNEQPGRVAGGGVQRAGQGTRQVLEPRRGGRGHPPAACGGTESGRPPRPLLRAAARLPLPPPQGCSRSPSSPASTRSALQSRSWPLARNAKRSGPQLRTPAPTSRRMGNERTSGT